MPEITPFLWFDTEAEAAAAFYVSLFPNSKIVGVTHYPEGGPRPAGMVMTVSFELDGKRFTALNAGPQFTFDQAISFVIPTKDQAETDRYYDALIADGGREHACGWVQDRFGLCWQVTPDRLMELVGNPDKAVASRAMGAMMTMRKIDIAAIEAAAAG